MGHKVLSAARCQVHRDAEPRETIRFKTTRSIVFRDPEGSVQIAWGTRYSKKRTVSLESKVYYHECSLSQYQKARVPFFLLVNKKWEKFGCETFSHRMPFVTHDLRKYSVLVELRKRWTADQRSSRPSLCISFSGATCWLLKKASPISRPAWNLRMCPTRANRFRKYHWISMVMGCHWRHRRVRLTARASFRIPICCKSLCEVSPIAQPLRIWLILLRRVLFASKFL